MDHTLNTYGERRLEPSMSAGPAQGGIRRMPGWKAHRIAVGDTVGGGPVAASESGQLPLQGPEGPEDVSKKKRDVYISPGVLPQEEPVLEGGPLTLAEAENFRGAVLPWNYIYYLWRASQIAAEAGVQCHVVVLGTGRLLKQYGIEAVSEIAAPGSTCLAKNEAFTRDLQRIIEQEKIRAAVASATYELLGIENIGSVVSATSQARENSAFGKRMKDSVAELAAALKDNQPRTRVGQFPHYVFPRALEHFVIPPSVDELDPEANGAEQDDASMMPNRDMEAEKRYPLAEIALAFEIIMNRDGDYHTPIAGPKRKIVVPDNQKIVGPTGPEALRDAACWQFAAMRSNEKLGQELHDHWKPTETLAGITVFPAGEGENNRIRIKLRDPYYGDPSMLNVESDKKPFIMPALPWVSGSLRRLFPAPSTRITPKAFNDTVNSVVRARLAHIFRDPSKVALLMGLCSGPGEFDKVQRWFASEPTDKDIIPFRTPDSYNDFVRGFCVGIATRANDIFKKAQGDKKMFLFDGPRR